MNKTFINTRNYLRKNSPSILTYVACVGVVGVAMSAIKGAKKYEKLTKSRLNLSAEEKIIIGVESYAPLIFISAATMTCIIGSNKLNKNKQQMLIGAYTLLDSSYKNYRNKVIELYGEDFDKNIRVNVAKDKYTPGIELDEDSELFYDDISGRYFESTRERVLKAQYELNKEMALRDLVSVNEYYKLLGLDPVPADEYYGWAIYSNPSEYGHNWIDFNLTTVEMEDGLECTIIESNQDPHLGFDTF